MIRFIRLVSFLTAACSFALTANAWIGGVNTQKFIGHGWDTLRATPEEMLAHADDFDRSGLDGVTVCLWGKTPSGTGYGFTSIMTDAPWEYAALQLRLETLRKFREHPGLRESFLMFWLAPKKRIALTDDEAWNRFADNVGVLAKLGAKAGMRGYFVDGEDYPKTRQFFYDEKQDGIPYAAACKLARKRGAAVFGALFAQHPDATLLSFWFLSLNQSYAPLRDTIARMKASGDLWPSFVNGLLDVMPATATFVDGDEHAYNYESSKKDFYLKSFNQRHSALGLVAAKNRAKYAAQLSVGFGLYLDKYKKPEDLAHFERNLVQAAEVSTEYVWIYGEKHNWVGWKKLGDKTWEQALPGLSEVLWSIKVPEGLRTRKLAELKAAGKDANLVRKEGLSTWKEDKAKTVFEQDGLSYKVTVGPGSVLAGVPAKEGEFYAASVAIRCKNAKANVHWRRKGAFDWDKPEFPLFLGEPDKDGWRRGTVAARVPTDVDELVVQCDVLPEPGETAVCDGFSVVRLR